MIPPRAERSLAPISRKELVTMNPLEADNRGEARRRGSCSIAVENMSGRQALEKLFRCLARTSKQRDVRCHTRCCNMAGDNEPIRHLPIAMAGMGNRACHVWRETGGSEGNIQILPDGAVDEGARPLRHEAHQVGSRPRTDSVAQSCRWLKALNIRRPHKKGPA